MSNNCVDLKIFDLIISTPWDEGSSILWQQNVNLAYKCRWNMLKIMRSFMDELLQQKSQQQQKFSHN